jgi:hypothetical protein
MFPPNSKISPMRDRPRKDHDFWKAQAEPGQSKKVAQQFRRRCRQDRPVHNSMISAQSHA